MAGNSGQTRMNFALPHYSDFFGVSSSRSNLRIRNDEAVGSIPTSSTMFSITCNHPILRLRSITFQFSVRPSWLLSLHLGPALGNHVHHLRMSRRLG
jgi:hypothetical protein